MITKIIAGILLLFGFVCFSLSLSSLKRPIVNGLFLLVLLNLIYYLLSDKHFFILVNNSFGLNELYTFTTIKGICYTLLFFFIAFYLSKNNKMTESNLKIFFYIFFFMAILRFFVSKNELSMEIRSEEFTNNAGYGFVHLFPFLFLIKRKKSNCNWNFIFFVLYL